MSEEIPPGGREVPPGGRPRVLAPVVAALMISLSLERLGALHWIAATALFVLLVAFVAVTELRKRKAREDFHAQDR